MATWLTGKEAIAHLKLSKPTFYKLVKEGHVTPHFIPGVSDPRYLQEELDALPKPAPKQEAAE